MKRPGIINTNLLAGQNIVPFAQINALACWLFLSFFLGFFNLEDLYQGLADLAEGYRVSAAWHPGYVFRSTHFIDGDDDTIRLGSERARLSSAFQSSL